MTDNNYWQFQNLVDANPLMLSQQQQTQQAQTSQPPQTQQAWSEDNDERKWGQGFSDFDLNAHANKMFNMDDYSNHEPSEGDSPDSGGGSGSLRKRNDLASDSSFMGGDQKQRRKEQNRAAQRAFRERKERFVKELQTKIKEMEKKHELELNRVTRENDSLKALVKKMEAEIYTLKGAAIAFDVSIHKLREAGLDVQKHHQNHPSPPHSDQHSPSRLDDTLSYISGSSDRHQNNDISFGYNSKKSIKYRHEDHMMSTDEENDDRNHEEDSFAERETNRFEHKIDPIVYSGVKLIPCSQIWEKLSQHPNFDEFDMDQLCEELKKKARCSGTGPVIPESELQEVLRRMDFGTA